MTVGAPYVSGSETSREAAESVAPIASGIRAQIFEWIRERGREGSTCDEVEAALGLRHQTASARVRELLTSGALVDSGRRRKTRSGRTARVVVVPLPGSLRRPLRPSGPSGSASRRERERARELREDRLADPSRLDEQQRTILDWLFERGAHGATCDEIEEALALSHQCASARVRRLISKRLAEDSGRRRETRSGRSARVVVALGLRSSEEGS